MIFLGGGNWSYLYSLLKPQYGDAHIGTEVRIMDQCLIVWITDLQRVFPPGFGLQLVNCMRERGSEMGNRGHFACV